VANIGEVNVFDGNAVTLRIDVLDAAGVALGSREVSIEYRQTVMLYDVARSVGVATLTDADQPRDRAGVARSQPLPGDESVADGGQDQRALAVVEVVERLVVGGLEGVQWRRPPQASSR